MSSGFSSAEVPARSNANAVVMVVRRIFMSHLLSQSGRNYQWSNGKELNDNSPHIGISESGSRLGRTEAARFECQDSHEYERHFISVYASDMFPLFAASWKQSPMEDFRTRPILPERYKMIEQSSL